MVSQDLLFVLQATFIICLAIIVSALVFLTCLYYAGAWARITVAPDSPLRWLSK